MAGLIFGLFFPQNLKKICAFLLAFLKKNFSAKQKVNVYAGTGKFASGWYVYVYPESDIYDYTYK